MNTVCIGAMFAGVISFAATAYADIRVSDLVTVAKIDVETDPVGAGPGFLYIQFNSAPFTTECSANPTGTGFWMVAGSEESVKAIHASALAAKLAGSPVRILFNDTYSSAIACSGGGKAGFPMLRGFSVE